MPDANGAPLEAERRELETALAALTPETDIGDVDELAMLIFRAFPNQIGGRFVAMERACTAAKWKGEKRKMLDKAIKAAERIEKRRAADDESGDPAHRLVARVFDKYGGRLLYDGQYYRTYTGTHWQPITLAEVQVEIIELGTPDAARMNSRGQISALPHLMEGTLKLLEPAAARNVPATSADPRRALINVQNGTLDFDRETWTPKLRPHDAEDGMFYMLNVPYDPQATCPEYDRRVREIFARTYFVLADDRPEYDVVFKLLRDVGADSFERRHTFGGIEFEGASAWCGRTGWLEAGEVLIVDVEENVRFYEEMAGYAMTAYRGFNKFVIFHGREGVNGKSMLSRLLKEFVPSEAIHSIPDIGMFMKGSFSFAQLRNKLLVICDDMNRDVLEKNAGPIKQLSWNTDIASDDKFERHFAKFRNTSLLFLIGNDMGSSAKLGAAFFDRVLFFDFNNVFKRNDSVWERGVFGKPSEMAGVFLRFVNGLARAMKRGTIEPTRAARSAVSRWIADYNLYVQHLQECATSSREVALAHGNSDGSSVTKFHMSLLSWWHDQRVPGRAPSKNKYLKALRSMQGITLGDSGHQGQYIRGLWLRPDKEFPFSMEVEAQILPFNRERDRERDR